MTSQWYCSIASQQYGPFPLEQLQQWVAEGRLQADHHVCLVGQQEWTVARDVPQLFGPPTNSQPFFSPQTNGSYPAGNYPQADYSSGNYAQSPPSNSETGFQIKTGPTSYAITSKAKKDRSLQFAGAVVVCMLTMLGVAARVARVVLRSQESNERYEQQQQVERQAELRQRKLISDMSRPPPMTAPKIHSGDFEERAKKLRQPWQK